MVGLDDLTRRAEASQQLYDSYLARYKQTGAEEGTERPESRIISYADLPMAPTSPRVALNLILALVIGTGLGVASAFIAEMMFSGLTTALDVEQRLRIRCLGSIPLLKSVLPRSGSPIQSVLDDPGSGLPRRSAACVRRSITRSTGVPSCSSYLGAAARGQDDDRDLPCTDERAQRRARRAGRCRCPPAWRQPADPRCGRPARPDRGAARRCDAGGGADPRRETAAPISCRSARCRATSATC